MTNCIRTIQHLHGLDNFPEMVSYICLAYYWFVERFESCSSSMTISSIDHPNDTVKISGSSRYSDAVGSKVIHSMDKCLTRWDLKADTPSGYIRVVGITSNWDNLGKFYERKDCFNYGYNGYNGDKVSQYEFITYGPIWDSGDIIRIELDLRTGSTLKFYKNGVCPDPSQSVAYEVAIGEDIEYKLIVGMYGQNDGVTIIHFEQSL